MAVLNIRKEKEDRKTDHVGKCSRCSFISALFDAPI